MIGEVWDRIVEEFEYFISFEWFFDIKEFFSGMFENISEFSIAGTIYGIIMVVLVYFFRKNIFVFVDSMGTGGKIIWYPVFFIFAFVIGYIMGRKVWD